MKSSGLWKGCTVLLSIVSIALLIAVTVLTIQLKELVAESARGKTQQEETKVVSTYKSPTTPTKSVFDTLTEEEIIEIRNFMFNQPELNLVPIDQATVSSNYIYLIESVLPSKKDVLEHLDSDHTLPVRSARVTCFMGEKTTPRVEEFLVFPIPKVSGYTRYINPVQRPGPIPWNSRPDTDPETNEIDKRLVGPVMLTLYPVLKATYGYWYHNCTDRCIFFVYAAKGLVAGDRQMYVRGFRAKLDGYYLWPMSLALLVNCNGNDPSKFKLTKLYYEENSFHTAQELLIAYNNGSIKKRVYGYPPTGPTYGSPDLRGEREANWKKLPKQTEPDGRRFTVDGQKVKYLDWEFNFRLRAVTGLQVMDMRYKDERIAYEVSMADIIVLYSGKEPEGLQANLHDASWSIGARHRPLLRGYDCPDNALYFNNTFFDSGTGTAQVFHDALCLFEHNTALPISRHTSVNFYGSDNPKYLYKYNMPGSVMILRGIPTLWNYDYIFDFVFHPNGVMETRVAATGYVQPWNWSPGEAESPYGNFINREFGILANLHHHLFNFKFDLDIRGQLNRFETWDITLENRTNPLAPGKRWYQTKMNRTLRKTEKEALVSYIFEEPKYYVICNQKAYNSVGYPKGYRIFSNSFSKQLLPEGWQAENGFSWSRYQVAVTKFKDNEDTTASLYGQAEPYCPVRKFEKFYSDNENIVDRDLVAWVSLGLQHIPVMEDIPVTTTPGKQLSVVLAPLNYFDEDPTLTSQDAIVIRPED
ncbi:amiloride-sensitive amine oxidase [copper-containing]-like [Lingula anatina]|uniref:Amine oxidase n=1 Tax=Lingula anatina TaxID=7574 RepID=A0A1S3J0C3_LINAN|nr:amiloride-sensitive amine oxidase [copper-containing]-like [Lingula anatina]|eukprot:XP_013403897.1 amiloride-sensitive amine oxidase [copper-containing]-like [Lingula anatina]